MGPNTLGLHDLAFEILSLWLIVSNWFSAIEHSLQEKVL